MKIGETVHHLRSCSSTNDVAKELAEKGAEEGLVVTADAQTRGRGTRGRSWHSPSGLGLYASVILRPRQSDISLLSVAAGISVADAIQKTTGLEVELKWPNDIIWSRRKLGGVLCESAFRGDAISYAVLGIGVNLSQKKADFPPSLRSSAVSLRMILKRNVEGPLLLENLWQALGQWYDLFCREKREEIVLAYSKKSFYPLGKKISIKTLRGAFSGFFHGLDLQGGLALEQGGKRLVFSAGEIEGIEEENRPPFMLNASAGNKQLERRKKKLCF